MGAHVALELERVTAGVVAYAARVGPLARVHSHVSLQLAQLNRRVLALRALVRLLHRMPIRKKRHSNCHHKKTCDTCKHWHGSILISLMARELATSRERLLACAAFVRLGAQMQVAMIGELNLAGKPLLAVLALKSGHRVENNVHKFKHIYIHVS